MSQKTATTVTTAASITTKPSPRISTAAAADVLPSLPFSPSPRPQQPTHGQPSRGRPLESSLEHASDAHESPAMSSSTSSPVEASASSAQGRTLPASQRTISMDSTFSTLSTPATPQPLRSPLSNTDVTDIAALIASAGSPEAAITKLVQEKQSASAHTAQLWRLVEKQRAMILGLNKDLERNIKEKEKYRKRLKDQLERSASGSFLPPERASLASIGQVGPASSRPLPTSVSLDNLPSRAVPASTSTSASSLPAVPPPISTPSPTDEFNAPLAPGSVPTHRHRKEPPAPLDLSSAPALPRESPVSDEMAHLERGRLKTREDDDRQREALATKQEPDVTSPPPAQAEADSEAVFSDIEPSSPQMAQMQTFQSMGQLVSSEAPSQPRHHNISVTVLSPGLPMSPRPGDRPMNSPMPRALKQTMIPTSPRLPGGTPLSPRAPRQPIPLPPQTPLSFASPHLARAENYHSLAPSTMPDRLAAPSPPHLPDTSVSAVPRSPDEIYRGLVSEQYPGLLLPPNALPSIHVKVDSSRLRPSRNSFMAPKPSDENPVITLAVFARSDHTQLWRLEKSLAALSVFDQQLKSASSFRTKLPDRALFTGHAPSKMDARRTALGVYFNTMLDTPMEDSAAVIICGFLTADALAAGEHFPQEPTVLSTIHQGGGVRKDGYLTKRGKNFGGWKARYFVLDDSTLKYFEAPGGALMGSIKLAGAQIGKQAQQLPHPHEEDDDDEYRHAFLVLEPKRKDSLSHVRHVLCAESDTERDSWVEALMQCVNQMSAPTLRKKDSLHASKSPRLQKSMTDVAQSSSALRSVPYQATVAAEAPVIGPTREQATPSPVRSPLIDDGEAANYPPISGPTNGTIIQNAESWGNKRDHVTHTKDKKRSIFGFRGRSSSDTVPGGMSKDWIQSPSPTPVRPVFGAPLIEAVEIAPPTDVPVHLPAVVYRSIEYLRAKNASQEEGIFRLSGSNIVIKALKERFNVEGDVKLVEDQYYDIHAVASLLKLYLRELPASILTREAHLEFLKGLELDGKTKIEFLNVLVNKLPRANRELIDILATFLREIVDNEAVNKMSVRNVGIVFAPTLNIPAPLISLFVMENDKIFGPPIDISTPTYADTPMSNMTPESIRSPRNQSSVDLSTSGYHQMAYETLTAAPPRDDYDQDFQNGGGVGASEDMSAQDMRASQSRNRNVYPNGAQKKNAALSKQARRESNTLFMNIGPMAQREPGLSRLRESDNYE